ncbi:MAG: MBL fold metallo-hydrolase, partial [Woeseiaceae bacterium]|nr:MBL fold metallo-hydrolase [Woeseiaceae bacterium]
PGIYMIEGVGGFGGGNMGLLVGESRVAMIDDSVEPLSPMLLEHVEETTDRAVDFMINTHVHGDHAGGNASFAELGTVVFAHANIRKRLLVDPSPAGGAAGLPVVTYGDGVTFHLGNIEARVMHLPNAHTDGDSVIYFPKANVLHTGDIMFNGLFPFIDMDNGGSVTGYIAAQKQLLTLVGATTKIIPGHGPLASREDLKRNLDVLIDGRERIKRLVDQGMSDDDIVAANPLADYHDTYNWAFITTERMTRTHLRALREGK